MVVNENLLSATDLVFLGLEMAGFKRLANSSEKTNFDRFNSLYGATARSCHELFLQISEVDDRQVHPKYFLLALRFLKEYPTEQQLCGMFNIQSEKTVRKWTKIYVKKIQELLPAKVRKDVVISLLLLFC